eukprot:TRINITY_DN7168_c0_g1_i1.p1 TRINITY_DN7168_c0_g1~~TRINITY_DN7168_c0_g1_i1.p1  ORF type:complete len:374 (+),score=80.13 TRINITY_DN7168_c0_g1_i1:2307-3428(+)
MSEGSADADMQFIDENDSVVTSEEIAETAVDLTYAQTFQNDNEHQPVSTSPAETTANEPVSRGSNPSTLGDLMVHCYTEVDGFSQHVASFLREKPYRNSTILTIINSLKHSTELPESAFLCCVTSETRVVAVVVQFETWHGVQVALAEDLSLDEGVDAFHVACEEMRERKIDVNRAEGLLRDAQLFSGAAIETRLARHTHPEDQQQHYKLGDDGISLPRVMIPGELHVVEEEDVLLLVPDYYSEVFSYFDGGQRTMEQCKSSLEAFARDRMLLSYRYKGHTMAVMTLREVTAELVQVTAQYTVSCYRQRGFGPMLLYEAVEYMLGERGYKDVIVAASSEDEATNSVYWRLGFEPSEITATYAIQATSEIGIAV